MNFETHQNDGVAVVDVIGTLDVATATELTDYLGTLLKRFPKKVILNLEGVGYMASSGLAMLVSSLKKSKEMRVPFAICGMSPAVLNEVKTTGLGDILPIYQDVKEAEKALD